MGSDQCIRKYRLVDFCCNGACFGFGFVVTIITLIAMFWVIWFYFGLTFIQVSDSQRRALVDYSYVPPSTSSPNRYTPPEALESSFNQISKLATVSSNFPRIDPTAELEKKSEVLNERQTNPSKGDFAPRSRSNKTRDVYSSPSSESERKLNSKEGSEDTDKSTESNRQRKTQLLERRNISSTSEDTIIPTRVHSEIDNGKRTYVDQQDGTHGIAPSAVLNSKLPSEDQISRNPKFGSDRDSLPNRNSKDRDESIRNRDRNIDEKTLKGDIRVIPLPPFNDETKSKDGTLDPNRRSRGENEKSDHREDRYRDRPTYDGYEPVEDRKRDESSYRPPSTRNNRNRDRIFDEDSFVDDRRRGDVGKYDDKPFEERYQDRTRTDQRYSDERRSDRYDNRGRILGRDRIRAPLDDEYLERYPIEEKKNRDDFRDSSPRKEIRYRDRLPYDDSRSVVYRDEEIKRGNEEKVDGSYSVERRNNDKIPIRRDQYESRGGYDEDKHGSYDRRKVIEEDEHYYSDQFGEDRIQPNRTRSRIDDRYNYRDEALDSSRYNSKDIPYHDYSSDDESRSGYKEVRRDSIASTRSDYRPIFQETRTTRPVGSTRDVRRYQSSTSRDSVRNNDSDSRKDFKVVDRNRDILRDATSDKIPRIDESDRIAPTRVRDDRYKTQGSYEDTFDPYHKNVDRPLPDIRRRPAEIETKYQNENDRPRTVLESSRDSSTDRRDNYPTEEVKNYQRSKDDEISLERRSYSSEDDEYRLRNTQSRTNQPDRTLYDDKRRDYSNDRRRDYSDDRRRDYSDDRRRDYSDDRRREYSDDRRREYSDDRRRDYSDDRRRDYSDDRRRDYSGDRRRDYSDDKRSDYSGDRKRDYDEDRRSEDRRQDYRSDDPSKKYYEEDRNRQSRRTNEQTRGSLSRDGSARYDNVGDKLNRDIPDKDVYDEGSDRAKARDEYEGEPKRYNQNRDKFDDRRIDDRKIDEQNYSRNRDRHDDHDDQYFRDRDRYDYRYKEDRYDQNRDRYVDDSYEERSDLSRDSYNERRHDQNRNQNRDDTKYETSRYDRNRDIRKDDGYVEDRYRRPAELRPRDELPTQIDRVRSRDSPTLRSQNSSPSRSDEKKGSFLAPSDVPKTPIFTKVDNQEMIPRDSNRRDSFITDYDANRPLSAKDVIDTALRQAENPSDFTPKNVHYPVFDPRITNLTSSDIIRPSERRGITVTTRKRRKRELPIEKV